MLVPIKRVRKRGEELVSKFNLGGGGEEILCHSTLRCAIAR